MTTGKDLAFKFSTNYPVDPLEVRESVWGIIKYLYLYHGSVLWLLKALITFTQQVIMSTRAICGSVLPRDTLACECNRDQPLH